MLRRRELIPFLLLTLILMLAAVLRVHRMGFDSLTFDEQWHLELSTGRGSPHVRLPQDVLIPDARDVASLHGAPPVWTIWTHMDFVVHPPLYCIALRLWRDVFGDGDAAAQALSVTWSLASITILFLIGRELHGSSAALWACAMLAAAPTQVLLAQQAREYPMAQALSLAGALAALRILRSDARRWPYILLGASILAMMLTHYFTAGVCLSLGVFAILRLPDRSRQRALLAFVTAAFVYLVIWGPFLWHQRTFFAETGDAWLKDPTPNHALVSIARAASIPWRQFTKPHDINLGLPMVSVSIVLAAIILLCRRRDLLLWCLWIGGTIGFVLLIDLARTSQHLALIRYTSLAAPAIFMLVAAIAARWGAWQHILPAIVVVAGLVLWRQAYVSEQPDSRALGKILDQHAAPAEPLLFYAGTQPRWYNEIYYLGCAHYAHGWPRPIVKLSKPASPQLIAQLPGETAWLISGPLERPLDEVLPGAREVEHHEIWNLAILTRVQLPPRSD